MHWLLLHWLLWHARLLSRSLLHGLPLRGGLLHRLLRRLLCWLPAEDPSHSAAPSDYWTMTGNVRGPLAQQETSSLVAREQASIADSLPLGLAAFASATFTISSVLAGWFTPSAVAIAIPVAFVFGGIAQFLAGMWAFRRGNVLAATAFGSFGAFNTSWALL
ncbi:MAG: acetate uptake transporter family protein, partial [Ktedonobacterales bacterium]